jgi:hypothetical protein
MPCHIELKRHRTLFAIPHMLPEALRMAAQYSHVPGRPKKTRVSINAEPGKYEFIPREVGRKFPLQNQGGVSKETGRTRMTLERA